MAVVRFCDWLKTRLGANEQTVTLTVGDKEFEISPRAAQELLARLEADELPQAPALHFPPGVRAPAPQEQPIQQIAPPPPPLDIQIEADPFDAGPGSMPEPVQGQDADPSQLVQLEIPDDPKKRLGTPSRETFERVMREAKRFEPGTLPTLAPGGKARQLANQRLQEIESRKEQDLRKQAGGDVNIKSM